MAINYPNIQKYISSERLRKYEKVCHNDQQKSLKLYQTNLRLSQAFYSMLSLFEVILRNAINEELTSHFDDTNWLRTQQTGFMDHHSLQQRGRDGYLKQMVSKSFRELGPYANQGKIIADLTFGFWVAFFDVKHYRILGGKPIQIFKALPSEINRNNIHTRLKKVRDFRNRVYHNEPIIYKKDEDGNPTFNLTEANEIFEIIKDFYKWLELDFKKWTKRINNIPFELKCAENMFKNYPAVTYYVNRIILGLIHYYKKYTSD